MRVDAARKAQVTGCDDGVPARRRQMPGDKQALRSVADRPVFEGGCEPCCIGGFAVVLLAAREQCAAHEWEIGMRRDEEAAQQVVVARASRAGHGQIVPCERII